MKNVDLQFRLWSSVLDDQRGVLSIGSQHHGWAAGAHLFGRQLRSSNWCQVLGKEGSDIFMRHGPGPHGLVRCEDDSASPTAVASPFGPAFLPTSPAAAPDRHHPHRRPQEITTSAQELKVLPILSLAEIRR